MIKKYWKFVAIVVGAALGYSYYYFVGCRTGVCPITSNPWISTGYGALIGFVFTLFILECIDYVGARIDAVNSLQS